MDKQKQRRRRKGQGGARSAQDRSRRSQARAERRAQEGPRYPPLPLAWMPRFLAMYAQTRNKSWAATSAGVSVARIYQCRDEHPVFAQAIESVDARHLSLALSREFERAVFGWDEPVFGSMPGEHSGSGQIGTRRKFSEHALKRYLEVHDPARRELGEGEGPPAMDEAAALRAALANMAQSVPNQAPPGYVPPERKVHAELVIPNRVSNTPSLCVGCGHQLSAPAPQCPECDMDPKTGEPIGNPAG